MPSYRHNGHDYPQYHSPSPNDINVELSQLEYFLKLFCSKTPAIDVSKISVDEEKLIEICVRTDQRKLHYKMYHDIKSLNECKEAAVLAYWFVRLKPFTYDMGSSVYSTSHLNELFALYLVTSTIQYVRSARGLGGNFADVRILKDLLYALKFRPVMYDDLTLMVDSLAHA